MTRIVMTPEEVCMLEVWRDHLKLDTRGGGGRTVNIVRYLEL